jgi:RNA polymerase sigma factor (sigma-70 family)
MKIYNVDNYQINLEEGYLIMDGEKIFTPHEVLQEIVRNQWRLDKKNKKHKYYTLPFYKKNDIEFEFLDYISLPKSAQPEEIYERIVLNKLLKDAINQLPPKYAQAGILYFIEGYSEIEIGNILNCSKAMAHYYKKCFLQKLKNSKKLETYYK